MIGSAQPIGVFDSGMGGLTVLHECLVTLPHEDFVYLASYIWKGDEVGQAEAVADLHHLPAGDHDGAPLRQGGGGERQSGGAKEERRQQTAHRHRGGTGEARAG